MVTSVVHELLNIITSFHYGAIHFRFVSDLHTTKHTNLPGYTESSIRLTFNYL